jgi:hypothetical protein
VLREVSSANAARAHTVSVVCEEAVTAKGFVRRGRDKSPLGVVSAAGVVA